MSPDLSKKAIPTLPGGIAFFMPNPANYGQPQSLARQPSIKIAKQRIRKKSNLELEFFITD